VTRPQSTRRPALRGPIVIETGDDGGHLARYSMGLYRYLLSDGQVVDVTAIQDSSDLQAAVLHHFTSEASGVTIEGVVKVEYFGHGD
jgi:hypothetical protein